MKSVDFRYTDRPLKGLNLELFKETMSECLAKVQSAQSWKEKAASVKDIQRHLQGAERKLDELNPSETRVLTKELERLRQGIVTQLKSQSQLLAREKSRTLGQETVSTLRAVAQQLRGLNIDLATKVDPLKLLEFEETEFRERISIADPQKSWEDKHRDILAAKEMLDGLGPAISRRLQVDPTTRETALESRLITARKLEIASFLDGLWMSIRKEQEQMQSPERVNLEGAAQVKALQNEVAEQLYQHIMDCYPLLLFKPGPVPTTFNDEPDFWLKSNFNSFKDTVMECLQPSGEGAGSALKRIRHLNYLHSELVELTKDHLNGDNKEKRSFAEVIDGLRKHVAKRCEELENQQASQSTEEIQAVDEDDVENELIALDNVEDELNRLADLCRSPSTPNPVARKLSSIPEDRPL